MENSVVRYYAICALWFLVITKS